jgi:hypothetical protein
LKKLGLIGTEDGAAGQDDDDGEEKDGMIDIPIVEKEGSSKGPDLDEFDRYEFETHMISLLLTMNMIGAHWIGFGGILIMIGSALRIIPNSVQCGLNNYQEMSTL